MIFYLYWDESDPSDSSSLKLRRSAFGSLEEAVAQRDADVEFGRVVVCIESSENPLGLTERVVAGRNVVEFERGVIVG